MAKDIKRHLSHLKNGTGVKPTSGASSELIFGEIAVGYKAGEEALYILNSNSGITEFNPTTTVLALAENYTDGKINALDAALTGTPGAGKTLTAFSQTDGKVSATFSNISITKSQVSDFPTIGNGTLTIKGNATSVATFTANQTGDTTFTITGGTNVTVTPDATNKKITISASQPTVNNGTFTISGNGASVASTSANASANTGLNIKPGSNVTITTGTNEITIAASQPTVNNGTLTISGNGTSVTTFTANQSGNSGLIITGGTNVTVTPDATNHKITISASQPTVNNGVLSLQANGTTKTSFSANQSSNSSLNITSGSSNGTISVGGTDVKVNGFLPSETALTSTSDAKIPTSKAVANYVAQQTASALHYKGTAPATLPTSPKAGDLYVVATAGTYAGQACEVGDYIICRTDNPVVWDVINGENQVENSGTTLSWGTTSAIAKVDGTTITVGLPSSPDTWRNVKVNGTEKLGTGTGTGSLNFASGSTNGTISVAGTDVKVKGLGGAAYLNTGTTTGTVADGGHTHATTLTSDTGTSSITLAHGGKYKLGAGGTSVIFTMPSDNNSWRNVKVNGTEKLGTGTTTGSLDFTSGSTNGTISVEGVDVKVTGLGTAAYKAEGYFAGSGHTHSQYVNQNAFSNVKVGSTTIAADTTTDTLELSAATFVTLTPDATNDKVTIGVSTGTSSSTLARGDHSHNYATVAFKTVKVSGASTVDVVADAKEDTITFAKDDAIKLTGDATNDKVTFGLGDVICGDYA